VTQKPTGTGISAALMLAKFEPFPPNNSYSVGKASLKKQSIFLVVLVEYLRIYHSTPKPLEP
jgi:hypothetical protein